MTRTGRQPEQLIGLGIIDDAVSLQSATLIAQEISTALTDVLTKLTKTKKKIDVVYDAMITSFFS